MCVVRRFENGIIPSAVSQTCFAPIRESGALPLPLIGRDQNLSGLASDSEISPWWYATWSRNANYYPRSSHWHKDDASRFKLWHGFLPFRERFVVLGPCGLVAIA